MGQVAVCPDDQQYVKEVIKNNLTFYRNNLKGWSTLARLTCQKYDLPDPLEVMTNPWRPDRWRQHCKLVVTKHWEHLLVSEAVEMDSLQYLDIESLNLTTPMNIWRRAGLESAQVRKATVVSWMVLGVFKTRENLAKMKKVKTDKCLACDTNKTENLPHLLLYCPFYEKIRDEYLPRLAIINPKFSSIVNNEKKLIISILDPESEMLPAEARLHFDQSFKLTRSYCYNILKKIEKFYKVKEA